GLAGLRRARGRRARPAGVGRRGGRDRGAVVTFSLAGRCAASGRFGVVVTSSSPAVAARCAHARAGVGAGASQNVTDPSLGRLLLDLLASGLPAPEAMTQLAASAPEAAFRQLTCVDPRGRVASDPARPPPRPP